MADKEERIGIFITTNYTFEETKEGTLFKGKIEPHNAKNYTRKEAIEVMARAICKEEQHDMTGVCCDEICLKWKYFLPQAQSALNALLRDEK